ncbi:C40 family peptidase [Streptomyces niveus]|uniref:C40 family peptidase n=1 Tax=Streptomyces niveus TaxID=193462 RepID=UPI00362BA1B1
MVQQTLLRPPRQASQHKQPRTTRARARVHARVQVKGPAHRKPQPPKGSGRTKRGDRLWATFLLMVMFVLSLVSGVLLAVHGPSGPPSAAPRPMPVPAPIHGPEMPKPVKPTGPAQPGTPAVENVELRPGDTLYALAGAHGTSVKALQKLNDLGTSTLIYAGDTLTVPTTPDPAQAQMGPPGTDLPDMEFPETDLPDMELPKNDPPKNDPPKKKDPKPDPPKKTAPKKTGAKAVVAFARAQLGKPYLWGGTGPNAYDCSGLVMRAWEKAGVQLPRTTWDQVNAGKSTIRDNLVPGDLIISNKGGHVSIYIGDGKVIHAPGSGKKVTTAPLPDRSDVVAYRHITP